MKRFSSLLGILGVFLGIAGGISYSIYQSLKTPIIALLVAGLAMMLYYCVINFSSLRGSLATRSTKYSSNTAVMIVVFLAIVVLLAAISSKRNKRFDLTEGKRYSLSSQSLNLLKSLNSDIKATAFFADSSQGKTNAKDLLQQYAYHSPFFKYEIIDPDRYPAEAKAYDVTTYGTIVFERANNKEKVNITSEEKFTNAILKISRDVKKVVYFLKGHGENDIADFEAKGYSEAKKAILNQSYEVKDLTLFDKDKVPEDASMIVISGPKKELFETELKLLEVYLEGGGKLFIMLDPDEGQGLVPFIAKYGIKVGDDIIIDKVSRLFGGDFIIPVVMEYGNHSITKDFNLLTFFPIARSVMAMVEGSDKVLPQNIAMTSTESWAETDKERLQRGEAAFDEGQDVKGPLSLAAVSTIELAGAKGKTGQDAHGHTQESSSSEGQKRARLVVFGDSDFASNNYLKLSGNKDLFLNAISWLAEEENLISIRPKQMESAPLLLSAAQGRVIFWFPVIIMPGAVLLVGALVTTRRRWRS